MTAFFIGSLSMIGIPPTGGFISKWYLIVGTVEAKQLAFLVVLLLSSVLNAIYFLPISYKAFFEAEEKPPDGSNSSTTQQLPADQDIKEIPLVTIPLMITAVLSLLLGVYPHYFLSLAQRLIP
jgi:multicomponent Na+:H+ antiporter subunit D